MPARSHRRRNFKKRNHTKRNTRRNTKHNTKRRINRRIIVALNVQSTYARMSGGDDYTVLSKSENYKEGSGPLAASHNEKAKGVLTRPVEWGVERLLEIKRDRMR